MGSILFSSSYSKAFVNAFFTRNKFSLYSVLNEIFTIRFQRIKHYTMKKYLMLMVAAASITTTTFGQKHDPHEGEENKKVPEAVKQAFKKEYPGTKVKWEMEDGKYDAEFKKNGKEMSVLYNANGSVKETEMEISVVQLPKEASGYITEHHMGRINEASKITKANGEVNYEAEINGKDLIFNSSGKFLKEAKD